MREESVVKKMDVKYFYSCISTQAAVVHLNFRAGSTFPVPVCTVTSSMDRTSRCNKMDAVRLYASYRMHLLLLKGQRCVSIQFKTFLQKKANNIHYYWVRSTYMVKRKKNYKFNIQSFFSLFRLFLNFSSSRNQKFIILQQIQ